MEDVNYVVTIDDERFDVEPFPIAIKDKSEYEHSETGKPGGKYAYDHSNCQKVEVIQVVDKGTAHNNDTVLTSESGNTTVTGFNFGDFLLLDTEMDKSLVTGLENKDYEIFHLDAVNPHRWEIAKLATGDFGVTRKIAAGKQVANVYYLDSTNKLEPVDFQQKNNEVSFTV